MITFRRENIAMIPRNGFRFTHEADNTRIIYTVTINDSAKHWDIKWISPESNEECSSDITKVRLKKDLETGTCKEYINN